MVHETIAFMKVHATDISKVGVLSTTGTYRAGFTGCTGRQEGFEVLLPTSDMQDQLIHPAIYHAEFGIKSQTNPVDPRAIQNLQKGVDYLKDKGAQTLILGCTEIPLAYPEDELDIHSLPGIDPTEILARALIAHAFPDKLKSLKTPFK